MSDTLIDQRERAAEVPQHVAALSTANVVRLARAGQKRRLAGARDRRVARGLAAELVTDTPRELVSMSVRELLLAMPRVGERGVTALVMRAGLTGGEHLGDGTVRHGCLTPRQRRALAGVLLGDDTPGRAGA